MFNLFPIFKKKNTSNTFDVSSNERKIFCRELINSSSLNTSFYVLLIVSVFIVLAGLLKNSMPLLIGGMLVAPMLSPVLGLSLALIIMNSKVSVRALKVFLLTTLLALSVSMFFGLIFPFRTNEMELIKQMGAGGFELFIAILAGAAASLSWVKKNLSTSLAGIAIAVTLLPPLAVAGLALAALDYTIFISAIWTYFINVLGIIIGSFIIFMALKVKKEEKQVVSGVSQENKEK
ncbi:MAG: TIGR00341 family protein [Clostridia bacterium]|nr:TIGR00341 family protein [Clostridia bacterium]